LKPIRLIILLLLAAVLRGGLLPGPAAAELGLETEALLKKVQAAYAGATSFRARYDLIAQGGAVAMSGRPVREDKAQGLMLYGRPDRLRLIQDSPLEEEMVIGPEGIWWYTSEDNEAHRYPASEFFTLFSPILNFFKGLEDYRSLEKGFTVSRMVGGDRGEEKAIKLVPHSHQSGLDRLEVWINPKGLIVQVAVYGLNGDRNTYRFKDIELLTEDPVEGFGFTPPAGARIVHH